MKTLLAIITILSITLAADANENPPAVNSPSPDFTLTNISGWKQNKASLKDFKGTWLIIDAWSLGCTSCIGTFPRMNALYKKMKQKATFILVGQEHKNIRGWFDKFRAGKNFELPYVFDSTFFELYQIRTVPRTIIIDPDGIIRVITTDSITETNLNKLFNGKSEFSVRNENGDDFDIGKPMALHNNGMSEDQFLFRSLLIRWKKGQDWHSCDFDDMYHWSTYISNGVQFIGAGLAELYRVAYTKKVIFFYGDTTYDRYYHYPVLEIKDSSVFKSDYEKGVNVFNYSLIVPDSLANNEFLRKAMIQELDRNFGLTSGIEEREMPVWEVHASGNYKRRMTKHGRRLTFRNFEENTAFAESNVSFNSLLRQIDRFHHYNQPPLINKTGIDFHIDYTLESLPTDFDGIVNELKQYGIQFVKATKKMKVLVIRDAE